MPHLQRQSQERRGHVSDVQQFRRTSCPKLLVLVGKLGRPFVALGIEVHNNYSQVQLKP